MHNLQKASTSASMLVNGYDTGAWESVTSPPLPKVFPIATIYANKSVNADTRCGCTLNISKILGTSIDFMSSLLYLPQYKS